MDDKYEDAQMKAVARAVAVFFKALVEEGLTREEALEVTCQWVESAVEGKRAHS